MTFMIQCDKCGKYSEEGYSLVYKFVGAYSEERQSFTVRLADVIDLCEECKDKIEDSFEQMIKDA